MQNYPKRHCAESGDYEFDAARYEKARVVFGDLVDLRDDKHYGGQTNPEANLPQFAPGEKVRLSCGGIVVYICRYSDTPYPDERTPDHRGAQGVR